MDLLSPIIPLLSCADRQRTCPRHIGAKIGFFSVLHTWDQRLQYHPHVHCVLAAGGLAPSHSPWISSRRSFFLPVKVLSRVFRGKFVAGLRSAFREGTLQFHGHLLPLAETRAFASWLRLLFRHHWVVYSKRPFGGQNMCCVISAHTPTALPSPTAGWLLSPTETSLFAGATPPTATRRGS